MAETIRSVLCGERWRLDSRSIVDLDFNADGTGRMIFGGEIIFYIAAEFDWSAEDSAILDQIIHRASDEGNEPCLLTEFDLNLTLTKRAIPFSGTYPIPRHTINEGRLEESAFVPRTFSVRLEKGSFISPHDMCDGRVFRTTRRYALRLSFDETPYPPTDTWKPDRLPLDPMQIEGWTAFYCEPMPLGDEFEIWEWNKHSDYAIRNRKMEAANGGSETNGTNRTSGANGSSVEGDKEL
ncbi:hypothetical protein FQN49_007028 [Arthroderma sp. PD_2]|nr:hypothetical protein FQN49_007028 [Arthroderma sp. PD_2]